MTNCLDAVEVQLRVATGGASGATGSVAPRFSFNWAPTLLAPGIPPQVRTASSTGGIDLVALAESVCRLRDDVDQVKDQPEAQAVENATKVFKSKTEGVVWLNAQEAEIDVYMFVDAIPFFSLCTWDVHESEMDDATQRAASVKVHNANTYQTSFIDSYSLEVPPLLGKGINADAMRATLLRLKGENIIKVGVSLLPVCFSMLHGNARNWPAMSVEHQWTRLPVVCNHWLPHDATAP